MKLTGLWVRPPLPPILPIHCKWSRFCVNIYHLAWEYCEYCEYLSLGLHRNCGEFAWLVECFLAKCFAQSLVYTNVPVIRKRYTFQEIISHNFLRCVLHTKHNDNLNRKLWLFTPQYFIPSKTTPQYWVWVSRTLSASMEVSWESTRAVSGRFSIAGCPSMSSFNICFWRRKKEIRNWNNRKYKAKIGELRAVSDR